LATIILGITGSIAAYKSCDIIRKLKKKEHNVICIITSSAKEFITPLTIATLSENPVYDDMFYLNKNYSSKIQHIELAKNCDLLLVAPATANIIGKVASGIADDLLTSVIMSTEKPVIFAPAMNEKMWKNEIVKENVAKLKKYGYKFIGPKEGLLACGDYGEGHIEDVDVIVEQTLSFLKKKSLNKKTVLILSGPTIEKIDDVRYITNFSSGKTGYFLAKEAKNRGADVIFITGKTNYLPDVDIIEKIESASEMLEKAKKFYKKADIIISVAAIADFTVDKIKGKIQRRKTMTLKLKPTQDVLAFLGKNKKNKILVGFAAEAGENIDRAKEKIKKKNLDFIVLNDILNKKYGFESDFNKIKIIKKDGSIIYEGSERKEKLGEIIFDFIEENLREKL
jgi:phosphopantothenoylcysteine decarboxylase/phosphopantothenate--cysteine ligase